MGRRAKAKGRDRKIGHRPQAGDEARSNRTGMKFSRRELVLTVAAMIAAWVVMLLLLAAWQRRSGSARSGSEPELIHYPGTEDVAEQTSVNIGLRRYWFSLDEAYPSKSVYHFYDREYGERGWRRSHPGEPEWYRRSERGLFYDLFYAVWVGPDRLFQVELQMKSEVKPVWEGGELVAEERVPGIKVYVTQKRVVFPGTMGRPERRTRPRGEIEVPSQ